MAGKEESHGLLQVFALREMSDVEGVPASESDIKPVAETRSKDGKVSQYRVPCRIALVVLHVVLLACLLVSIARSDQPLALDTPLTEQLAIDLDPNHHATRPITTIVFNWTASVGTRAPDGVQKRVYLVNGMQCHKLRISWVLLLNLDCRRVPRANH